MILCVRRGQTYDDRSGEGCVGRMTPCKCKTTDRRYFQERRKPESPFKTSEPDDDRAA